MKALTVSNILGQKVHRINFTGDFHQAFGNPQSKGVWFCWGTSGSGKSSFVMALAKEFSRTVKCTYNLLEEDYDDEAVIERTRRLCMHDVEENFQLVQDDFESFCKRLDRRNSPNVVIIDSATYFFKSYDQYLAFKKKYAQRKLIIITGHAKGSHPRSELELSIQFDAKQKIYTNGYLATSKGRIFGPNGGQFVIWPEGHERLRGE